MLPLVTVKPFFRWFDIWIGFYIDTNEYIIYFLPIPMCGLKIDFHVLWEEIGMNYGSFKCWLLGHEYMSHTYYPDHYYCEYCQESQGSIEMIFKEGLWLKTRINKILNRKVDNDSKK